MKRKTYHQALIESLFEAAPEAVAGAGLGAIGGAGVGGTYGTLKAGGRFITRKPKIKGLIRRHTKRGALIGALGGGALGFLK